MYVHITERQPARHFHGVAAAAWRYVVRGAGLITIIKIKRAAPIWQFAVANGSLVEKQANSIFQIKSRPMIYGRLRRCIWRRATNLAKVNSKSAQKLPHGHTHTHTERLILLSHIIHNNVI